MALVKDMKTAFTIIIFIVFGLFIFLLPWSAFVSLPDTLWFLQNKSLAEYLSQHIELVTYIIALICIVTIPVVILRGKRR